MTSVLPFYLFTCVLAGLFKVMQNDRVVTDILVRNRKPEKPWSTFPSSAVLRVPEPGTKSLLHFLSPGLGWAGPCSAGLHGCRTEGSSGGGCSLSSLSFSPGKAASWQTLECSEFVVWVYCTTELRIKLLFLIQ